MGTSSGAGAACPQCDQSASELDCDSGLLVCSNCGFVLDQADLWSRSIYVEGEATGVYVRDGDTGLAAGGQTLGRRGAFQDRLTRTAPVHTVRHIEALAGALGVRKEVTEQAKFLLEQSVRLPEAAGLRKVPLDILAATCLYIACRLDALPVTFVEAAALVHCNASNFGGAYRSVVSALGVSLPEPSLSVFIPRTVARLRKTPADHPRLLAVERDAMALWDWVCTVRSLDKHSLSTVAAVILVAADAHQVNVEVAQLSAGLGIGVPRVVKNASCIRQEIALPAQRHQGQHIQIGRLPVRQHTGSTMFKRIFGQGGQAPPSREVSAASTTRTVDAIQKLGETEDLLVKRRNLLEKKIQQEGDKAREYTRAKNKRAALMSLKKKKMMETQLEQVENNILRVNEQQAMLENQRTTVETVAALRNAAKASKSTMQEMKITDVDEVLDEINEQTDQMEQIQQAMGQPLGAAANLDEDELLAELEGLEAEELDSQLLEPAPVPTTRLPQQAQPEQALPNAPKTQVARPVPATPAKTAEELELEALEAEMAL
ncbi:hypothetical protein WJX72_000342 [[Myrmecia] bisecta]|uniref:Transcription factor TFIIB cyclin-like domain-containing protein n=1 Tax=[Myrmecia] bisecta TaxID=41462 RepID=A0AAW1PMX3_9CHLO